MTTSRKKNLYTMTENDEIMSECSTVNIDSGLDEQFENYKIIIDTSVIKKLQMNLNIHSKL
ncbi:hypothetical protein A3Q56_00751 [Intoshia linei]|uniref:Uncharacterized protein n=1 Tax=Intoshia linei TaxID=1819745 RepID=A0A177BB63_9BILA|nr:hypothetical protein A3Q56_00751 [Intoshia linei]